MCIYVKVAQLCVTLWLHGLYYARFLCPWNSPGKNTGVGVWSEPPFWHVGVFTTRSAGIFYWNFIMQAWLIINSDSLENRGWGWKIQSFNLGLVFLAPSPHPFWGQGVVPHNLWDLSSPIRLNPGPLQWKCGALTTGLPGNSPSLYPEVPETF